MEDQKDPQLNRDEALHAENNLLKIKLGMEHGMHQTGDTYDLSPEVENQWLKQIYAFEQQHKDAKPITLYDYLGRPDFLKYDTLTPEETAVELKRIRSIMAANDVEVDCVGTYDDITIYKFVTEELFLHEMDNMRIPGMVCHFIYEEFHPNHDHDLRRYVSDFLKTIFDRKWDEQFDPFALALKVTFSGKLLNRADVSAIIITFQEAHDALDLASLNITEVIINAGITTATVSGLLSVFAKRQGEHLLYEGACSFDFVREEEYWYIDAFDIPGIA